jgi:hypothetical protein
MEAEQLFTGGLRRSYRSRSRFKLGHRHKMVAMWVAAVLLGMLVISPAIFAM